MSLKTEKVRFGKNQEHLAFAAWLESARPPLPAIIVIQEAWGVDPHIEDMVIRFAKG